MNDPQQVFDIFADQERLTKIAKQRDLLMMTKWKNDGCKSCGGSGRVSDPERGGEKPCPNPKCKKRRQVL